MADGTLIGSASIARNDRTLHALTSGKRWMAIIGGVVALCAGPAMLIPLKPLLGAPSYAVKSVLCGCLGASAIVPSMALAIVATLSWRSTWERCLLFAPAFALQAAAYFCAWCGEGEGKSRSLVFLFVGPLLLLAGAMPAYFLRLWRRWMIAKHDSDCAVRPASIASLFWITGLWAVAAAFARFGDGRAWFDEPDPTAVVMAVVLFGILPSIWIGAFVAILLRAALSMRYWRSLAASVALGVSFILLTAVGIMIFLYCVGFLVEDHVITIEELLVVAIGFTSFCATTFAISFASCSFLRLLGYRIVHRGSRLPSQPMAVNTHSEESCVCIS
jgi:hypothetical protein